MNRLKKILASDAGALVLSKILYSNSEKTRIKKLNEHEFGFEEQMYWTHIELLHLTQPLLKAKYRKLISKSLLQENNERYALKINTETEDLIFIMREKEIEVVLLDPFERFEIHFLRLRDQKVLLEELCSFYIFFATCKILSCNDIAKYWDYIRTFAFKYDFYPQIIFHESGIFNSKDFQGDSIEPKFCLYSGQAIKGGYFKDSQASSDFFNPRYSQHGLFGKNVLNYSLTFNKTFTIKQVEESSNELFKTSLVDFCELSQKCGNELAKKIAHASGKNDGTSYGGDQSSRNLTRLFSEYFLVDRKDAVFNLLDVLILFPRISEKMFDNILLEPYPDSKLTLFHKLLLTLNTVKSQYCKNHKITEHEFYKKISFDGNPQCSLTKRDVKKYIKGREMIDPFSYAKAFQISIKYVNSTPTNNFVMNYDQNLALKILNNVLKQLNPKRFSNHLLTTRKQLFSGESFRFYKNTLEQNLLKSYKNKIE